MSTQQATETPEAALRACRIHQHPAQRGPIFHHGNHVSQHTGIGKLKAKAVRKLVNHDSEVLQALVDTTRMANELADEMSALDDIP